MHNALCCTKCGEVLIKAMDNGETKLRAKVIVFDENNQAKAICKGCNTEISVPLKIDEVMLKSIGSNAKLRLYVRK